MNTLNLVCIPLSVTAAGWLATSFTITAEPTLPVPPSLQEKPATHEVDGSVGPGHPDSHRLGPRHAAGTVPPPLPESTDGQVSSVILDLSGSPRQ